MDRNHLFVALVLVCIANGMLSPFVLMVMAFWPAWYPSMIVPVAPEILFYCSSLIVSTATLLLAGIPAALYERGTGLDDSTGVSVTIWLAGAIVLTLPAVMGLTVAP